MKTEAKFGSPNTWLSAVGMLLIALLVMFVIGWFDAGAVAVQSKLYLLYGEACEDLGPSLYFPFDLYSLDAEARRLDSVWSLRRTTRIEGVRPFPQLGSFLLTEGYPPPSALSVLSTSSLTTIDHYDLSSLGTVTRIRQLATNEPLGQISVTYTSNIFDPQARYSVKRVSVGRVTDISNAASENTVGELRLAGVPSRNAGGDGDVLSFRDIKILPQEIKDSTILASAFPVPDSVIQMKDSFLWTLFAHESSFLALHSVSGHGGIAYKEILIYNRSKSSWASIMVPGDETPLRPVNNWIVGEVTYSGPGTDWKRRVGAPPILTDSILALEPSSLKLIIAKVGSDAEVLWIEDSTAWYRVQDSLFTATVAESDFINRTLILADPRVKHIHWAFRGGETAGVR